MVVGACSTTGLDGTITSTVGSQAEPRTWNPTSDAYSGDFEGVVEEILADGVVTPAELERAVLASFACMEAEGIEVEPEIKYGASGWIISTGYTLRTRTEEELESVNDLAMGCEVRLTEAVWDAVRSQLGERDREAILQEVITCMEDRGVAVGVEPVGGPSELSQLAPEVFDYCWLAAH